MEYVSPSYQNVLDSLAESLRVQRREQFLAQLATAATIPEPRPELSTPQVMAELV